MKKTALFILGLIWICTAHAQERFVARIISPQVGDLTEFL
jgi:hypothetical protein